MGDNKFGFNFSAQPKTGFSFGTPTTTSGSLFGSSSTQAALPFGQQTATTQSTGFSFGTPSTGQGSLFAAQPTQASFPFGQQTAAAAPVVASTGFSFNAPTTTSGFSFGTTTTPATLFASPATIAASPFGQQTTTTTSGFSFGTPNATSGLFTGSAPQNTLPFGQNATTTASTFSFPSQSTAPLFSNTTAITTSVPSSTSQFPLVSQPLVATQTLTTSQPLQATIQPSASKNVGFAFPTTLSTSTVSTTTSAPSLATTGPSMTIFPVISQPLTQPLTTAQPNVTKSTGFTFPTTTSAPLQTTTISSATSAPLPVTNTQSISLFPSTTVIPSTSVPATTISSVSITTPAAVAPVSTSNQISFKQLEDNINIWFDELNHLETDFQQQAQTINSWDSLLVNNAVKITQIDESLEKLKSDYTKIDHQLDFIVSQQNELESLLEPLENIKIDSNITDTVSNEREETYSLVEQVNNDLQTIETDLRDFIQKLNEAKTYQESNDPLSSVTKILNSHMDALDYIDTQINEIKTKIEQC